MTQRVAQAAGGLASVNATWVGATAPLDGDTILIPAGTTVTWDIANRILGSKASSVGTACEIRGSVGSSGKLIVNPGVTLTLRGADRNGSGIGFGNVCANIEQYAEFVASAGSTIVLDPPSDGGATFVNHGIITSIGTSGSRVVWTGPVANRSWTTAIGLSTGSATFEYYDRDRFIASYAFGGAVALSNAAGTGPGTFGDSSVAFSAQLPAGIITTAVASIELVNGAGKFYVDHDGGRVYFYLNQVGGTFSYSWTAKRLAYIGSVILSNDNFDNHSATFRYTDFNYLGGTAFGDFALVATDKGRGLAGCATRDFEVTHCRFWYSRGVQIVAATGTLANPIRIEDNDFKAVLADGTGSEIGLINSSTAFLSIQRNTRPSSGSGYFITNYGGVLVTHTNAIIKDNVVRAASFVLGGPTMASVTWPGLDLSGNAILGGGSAGDTRQLANLGGTVASPAVVHDNFAWRAMRLLNYLPYCTVRDNVFGHNYHHSINPAYSDSDVYFPGIVIQNNLLLHAGDALADNGYNTRAFTDGAIIQRNTVYDNTTTALSLNFRGDSSVNLSANLLMSSNITASVPWGINRDTDVALRRTVIHLAGMDYNDITPSVADVSGGALNRACTTTGLVNCTGLVLHNPTFSGAISGKTVVFTRTSNTNRTVTFDGGTAVQLVQDSGTATSGPNETTFGQTVLRGFLNDTAKTWSAADLTVLASPVGSWVHIHTGTGAGQVRRVTDVPSSHQLTIVPPWTTPLDATSQYALLYGERPITGTAGTMNLGVDARVLPASTQADATVAVAFHQLNINPGFADPTRSLATWDLSLGGTGTEEAGFARLLADPTLTSTTLLPYLRGGWTPANTALLTAGHDGGFVGAISPAVGGATHLVLVQQPAGFAAGSSCTTPAIVEARKADNTLDATWTGTMTATLAGGGTLTGPRTLLYPRNITNGRGIFYRLAVVGAGAGRTLTFASAGLASVTSAPFTVATATGAFDGICELPRSVPNPAYPTSFLGGTTAITAGSAPNPTSALQTQINTYAALVGVTANYKITLAMGLNLTPPAGGFILPVRGAGSTGIIVIESATLPAAEGTRVTAALMTGGPKVTTTVGGDPCFRFESASSYYQLVGFECTMSAAANGNVGLIRMGSDGFSEGSPSQTTVALVPHHLGLARMYVHGIDTTPATGLEKGVTLNSASTFIVDSLIDKCHGFNEGKAIQAWNGLGPFLIHNNRMEGNDITIILGGGSSPIPLPAEINADITITNNYWTKPTAWKGLWDAKNMLDTKVCSRVLVEGNVIENTWSGGQDMLINLKGNDQDGFAPWSGSSDITFRRNFLRNGGGALVIASNSEGSPSVPTSRLAVHDNAWMNINSATFNGSGKFLQFGMAFDVTIEHDSFVGNVGPTAAIVFTPDDGRVAQGFVYRNVIAVAPVNFGIYGDNTGTGSSAISHYAPSMILGGDYLGVSGGGGGYAGVATVLTAMSDVGFQTFSETASWDTDDPAVVCAAFALAGASALKHQGTDGRDPGCDMAALAVAIAGVFPGTPVTPPPIDPGPGPAAIAALVIVRDAGGGKQRARFIVQPIVKAVFADGTTATTFTGTITAFRRGGRGSLTGTLAKPCVAGVASWTDLGSTMAAPILIGYYTLDV